MKVITNEYNFLMEDAYRMIFDLEVVDFSAAKIPEADLILCQGLGNLGALTKKLTQNRVDFKRPKSKIIVVEYEDPHPFIDTSMVVSNALTFPNVVDVVFTSKSQRTNWGGLGKVIHPTLDHSKVKPWIGFEKYAFSYMLNAPQMDWSRGLSLAAQILSAPIRGLLEIQKQLTYDDTNLLNCALYLNTSMSTSTAFGLMLAAFAGAPCVSTNTWLIKAPFFISGVAHALRQKCLDIWNYNDFPAKFKNDGLDEQTRKWAVEFFDKEEFIAQWQELTKEN